jgi:hypothetical protein
MMGRGSCEVKSVTSAKHGGVVTLEQEPIPASAKLVERPQRKATSQRKQN